MGTRRRAAPHRSLLRLAAAGLAVALALPIGCAGIAAARRSPGVMAGGRFSPTRSPATHYGPDATRTCPQGGPLPIVVDDLADLAKESGKPATQADGRLCGLADTLLGWEEADLPSESVVSFLSWHFGLPVRVSRMVITTVQTEDPKVIAGQVFDPLSKFAPAAVQPRFGLATQRLSKNATRLVLLMQDTSLDLDPLPRRLELNGQATLGGRLLGTLENPTVYVADPLGRLETPSVSPGKAFQVGLRCGDRPGLMLIEIRAEDRGAATILADFPVACGTDLPTQVAVTTAPGEAPVDVALQERKILELVNAERAAAGLAPLAWDDSVATVARAISEGHREQARRGSATVIDPVERLKRVDVVSPLVLQNPGQGRTAEETYARFLTSPVHRSNLMNPEVTHAGVGIALGTGPEGEAAAFVTELFVRELPLIDTEALRGKLRAAVAQKRADARAPALGSEGALEGLAQRYAKELAAAKGNLAKERADEIVRPLYRSLRTLNILAGSKAEPLEFAEESGVLAGGKIMGVGVAQGVSPVFGKNAVYVVVLIGTRR